MAPRALSQARRWARVLALLVPLGLLGAVAASEACVKSGFSLGQSCLTDEDCFSGYCAQQICVAAPPLLDAEATGDAPAQPTKDAATDAAVDGDASRADAVGDAPRDVGGDNAAETAVADVAIEATADAPADVASESAADARADVRLDAADGG